MEDTSYSVYFYDCNIDQSRVSVTVIPIINNLTCNVYSICQRSKGQFQLNQFEVLPATLKCL